jgi:glycerophosphoryl diester phosphodiesterase
MVEVKEVAAQEAIRQVVLEERATERCVLASEHRTALQIFREPPFAVAASGPEIGSLFRDVLLRRTPSAVPYRALSVPERYRGLRVPTRSFVAAARRLGCPVHVWTIDSPSVARRLWADGVSGIVTNFPERIRAAREAAISY